MKNGKIKYVFFDLDGTLLPFDQDEYVRRYFEELCARVGKYGYEKQKFVKSMWTGFNSMVLNDGSKSNEEVFWEVFHGCYDGKSKKDQQMFNDFYKEDFDRVSDISFPTPKSDETVKHVKKLGMKAVLATNPVFPMLATVKRAHWAGLDEKDFEIITSYENSCHSKPNLEYYKDILKEIGAEPEECLMVGNDVDEDLVAENLGMDVFLLEDFVINKHEKDVSGYKRGSFGELNKYLDEINEK